MADSASAEAFRPRIVDVPLKGHDGQDLVVSVKRVHRLTVLGALRGVPGWGGGDEPSTPDETYERALAMREPMATICEAGIVAPSFSFSGDNPSDLPLWGEVDFDHQCAIFTAIMAESGFGGAPSEDTKSVSSTPAG